MCSMAELYFPALNICKNIWQSGEGCRQIRKLSPQRNELKKSLSTDVQSQTKRMHISLTVSTKDNNLNKFEIISCMEKVVKEIKKKQRFVVKPSAQLQILAL